MARAATNSDVYNAIAEPRRRAIFELLCETERVVNDVVTELALDQPSVSKHLRVLREVDLVSVRREGRHRFYSANPRSLEPIHAWIAKFERFWDAQLDSIQRRAEAKHKKKRKPRRSR